MAATLPVMQAEGTPSLSRLVAHVDKLGSLPASIQRVLGEAGSPRASAASTARILAEDPPLAARVLRVANSGFYARNAKVGDLKAAVARIGVDQLRGIVTAAGVVGKFGIQGNGLDLLELYTHSLAAALLVDPIMAASKRLAQEGAGEYFTAGLLHDIGLFVLDRFAPAPLAECLAAAQELGEPFDVTERRILGYTHGDVGALLLQRWRLRPQEIEAARHHHNPDAASGAMRTVASLMHVVGLFTELLGLGASIPGLSGFASLSALDAIGIVGRDIPALARSCMPHVDRAAELASALRHS